MRTSAYHLTVFFACNHAETREFRVSGRELLTIKDNLSRALCSKCTARLTQVVTEQRGKEVAGRFTLPVLKGSEPATTWARNLRAAYLAEYGGVLALDAAGDALVSAMQRAITLQLMQSHASAWIDRRPPMKGAQIGISADVSSLIRRGATHKLQPGGVIEYLTKSPVKAVRDFIRELRAEPEQIDLRLKPRLIHG